MMRFLVFGRPLPDWTVEAYHRTLLDDHAELVKTCDGFTARCAGYVQNHVCRTIVAREAQGTFPDFRNCSAFWFAGDETLAQAYASPDYLRTLRPDEKRFGNPVERVALAGRDRAPTRSGPIRSGGRKLMLLLNVEGTDPRLAAAIAEISRAALRVAAISLTAAMDFQTLRFVADWPLPYTACHECWFPTDADAGAAMARLEDEGLGEGAGCWMAADCVEHWILPPAHYA